MGDLQDKAKAAQSKIYEESILKAAIDVFLNHGYEEATVEQIAKKATTSPATIYRKFKRDDTMSAKMKILQVLFDKFWEIINKKVFKEVPDCDTTKEKLEKIVSIVVELYKKEPDFGHVIVFHARWSLDFKLYRNDRIVEFKSFVKDIVNEGISKGDFRPCNFDSFFEFYFCAIEGCLRILGLKKRIEIHDYYGVSFSEDDLEQTARLALSSFYTSPA